MKTKSKIPALRFKGFTDAWEQRKLSDIADRFNNLRVPITASERKSGDTPYYGANGIQDYVEGFTHDGEFILVAEDGANDLKNYPVQYVNGKVWVNNHAHVLQGKNTITDNKFLMNSIKNLNIEPFLVGGGRAKLNADVMMKLNILLPTFDEQQKIGSFFEQLDNTIALHQRKCEQTKELKKTMLQKMFPKKGERIPEIRFPEFTDEWEEKKLGEMLTERNVQQVPKEDAPLVSFTVENGVTPKTDRYDREFLVRTGDKKYKYTTFDDIVYNPANLKFGAIARNKFGDAVFSPIYVTLVADKEKVLPIFIERIVTNGNFIQESLRYQEGTVYERMSVKVPDFLSMKISIPSLPEQEAIGAYFQTLDQDIAQIEKKLADLKELKKTLLRQLFV